MWAIATISLLRLREAAFTVLLVVGLVISYCFAGLGTFSSDVIGQEVIFGDKSGNGTILLGTILLVLLGGLITIFTAAAEIPRDVSTRMIAIYLSKPVSRGQYVWGKFLGTCMLGLICSTLWITCMLICRHFVKLADGEALSLTQTLGQYWSLLLMLPISAVAVGISCYFSDIISMLATCVYIVICFVTGFFPMALALVAGSVFGYVLLVPYYCFPNLLYFFRSYDSPLLYVLLVVYAAAVGAVFVSLGRLRFERGDVF